MSMAYSGAVASIRAAIAFVLAERTIRSLSNPVIFAANQLRVSTLRAERLLLSNFLEFNYSDVQSFQGLIETRQSALLKLGSVTEETISSSTEVWRGEAAEAARRCLGQNQKNIEAQAEIDEVAAHNIEMGLKVTLEMVAFAQAQAWMLATVKRPIAIDNLIRAFGDGLQAMGVAGVKSVAGAILGKDKASKYGLKYDPLAALGSIMKGMKGGYGQLSEGVKDMKRALAICTNVLDALCNLVESAEDELSRIWQIVWSMTRSGEKIPPSFAHELKPVPLPGVEPPHKPIDRCPVPCDPEASPKTSPEWKCSPRDDPHDPEEKDPGRNGKDEPGKSGNGGGCNSGGGGRSGGGSGGCDSPGGNGGSSGGAKDDPGKNGNGGGNSDGGNGGCTPPGNNDSGEDNTTTPNGNGSGNSGGGNSGGGESGNSGGGNSGSDGNSECERGDDNNGSGTSGDDGSNSGNNRDDDDTRRHPGAGGSVLGTIIEEGARTAQMIHTELWNALFNHQSGLDGSLSIDVEGSVSVDGDTQTGRENSSGEDSSRTTDKPHHTDPTPKGDTPKGDTTHTTGGGSGGTSPSWSLSLGGEISVEISGDAHVSASVESGGHDHSAATEAAGDDGSSKTDSDTDDACRDEKKDNQADGDKQSKEGKGEGNSRKSESNSHPDCDQPAKDKPESQAESQARTGAPSAHTTPTETNTADTVTSRDTRPSKHTFTDGNLSRAGKW